jgi:hypothetical protein
VPQATRTFRSLGRIHDYSFYTHENRCLIFFVNHK